MLKACFDCGHDTILTDVIHDFHLKLGECYPNTNINKLVRHHTKTVEYTCRMCAQKWYVEVEDKYDV